jgi:hypothetical protein
VTVTGYVALWAVVTVTPPQKASFFWEATCYQPSGGSVMSGNAYNPSNAGTRNFSAVPTIISLPRGGVSENCYVTATVGINSGHVVLKVAWSGHDGAACQGWAYWIGKQLTCV